MLYYSENWYQATEKFYNRARLFNDVKWCVSGSTEYDIPYVLIGNGPNKIVINSGVHGIEGYFGSAAQIMFLDKYAAKLSDKILQEYTIALIHVVNGWGMQNRMREVQDNQTGGLVDLNRNFGIDFSHPDALPQNPKYELAHELLVSRPDAVAKKNALKKFYLAHCRDGVWNSISRGQYSHPFGLFYGGAAPACENKMTMSIYDNIMTDAGSLVSIGLHTGLGRFDRRAGRASAQLLVSHPENHKNTMFFKKVFEPETLVVPDNSAAGHPTLLGDLVDCLEARYAPRNIGVYTADMEIGTGEFPMMSPIYKRMDMGDARYDLQHYGKISPQTHKNLTESWYPSDAGWRASALNSVAKLYESLMRYIQRTK